MNTLYRPELLYSNGGFIANGEVLVSESGQFLETPDKFRPLRRRSLTFPERHSFPAS